MEPCFSADTHLYMTLFRFLYSPRILSHLYLWLYCCICPHLYLALFHHILRWHLLRGVSFLHPPLLVTFTLHLLPYYSTLMWHFPRASPRSISPHLNMVSFSLFLSHLYMTLILFIITRQYYSPQLLQGFSAEDFSLSLISTLPWGTSLPTAFPRRVFHDPFRFQPVFHTSFPVFSSDNHVLTRFSYIHGLSAEEEL